MKYGLFLISALFGAVSGIAADEIVTGNLTVSGFASIVEGVRISSIIDSDTAEIVYEAGQLFGDGSMLTGVTVTPTNAGFPDPSTAPEGAFLTIVDGAYALTEYYNSMVAFNGGITATAVYASVFGDGLSNASLSFDSQVNAWRFNKDVWFDRNFTSDGGSVGTDGAGTLWAAAMISSDLYIYDGAVSADGEGLIVTVPASLDSGEIKTDGSGNITAVSLTLGSGSALNGRLNVNGPVEIAADVKVKNGAVIRISPAGDLLMGDFTANGDPTP
jgi:hypothetical protein